MRNSERVAEGGNAKLYYTSFKTRTENRTVNLLQFILLQFIVHFSSAAKPMEPVFELLQSYNYS